MYKRKFVLNIMDKTCRFLYDEGYAQKKVYLPQVLIRHDSHQTWFNNNSCSPLAFWSWEFVLGFYSFQLLQIEAFQLLSFLSPEVCKFFKEDLINLDVHYFFWTNES